MPTPIGGRSFSTHAPACGPRTAPACGSRTGAAARRPLPSHGCPPLIVVAATAYHNHCHHPRATIRLPPSPTTFAAILQPYSSMNVSQGGQFWLGGDLIWRGGAGGGPASPPRALPTLTSSRAGTPPLGAPPPLQARLYVPRVALPPPLLQGQHRRY